VGDNKEIYNKKCDTAHTRMELEKEEEICATNLAIKVKCMSTNAMKWGNFGKECSIYQ
jgi:hypothetical protein